MLLTARAVPLTAAPATTAVVDTAAPATAAVVRTTTQPDSSWASATTRISELVRMDASPRQTRQPIVPQLQPASQGAAVKCDLDERRTLCERYRRVKGALTLHA